MYIKQLDTVDDLRDADRDVPRIYNELRYEREREHDQDRVQ